MTKKKKTEIDNLSYDIKMLKRTVESLNTSITSFKTKFANIESELKFIIDKETSEIKVLEKNGKWGGYTGVFYINTNDNKETVTNKALGHYGNYFEGRDFYKSKTLGLFITSPKSKKLVKILQDPQDKLKNERKLHADTIYTLNHMK